MNRRPRIGETVGLVYRECLCGWWCATGEGAPAPVCPNCGRLALPLGGLGEEPASKDDPLSRRNRSLGFVGQFGNEIDAFNKAAGIASRARIYHGGFGAEPDVPPYGRPEELRWSLFRIGAPLEPADNGSRDYRSGFERSTFDEVMAMLRDFFHYGPASRDLRLADNEIVALHDLTRPDAKPRDEISTPFTIVTPYGKLTAHCYGGDRVVKRCTCDRGLPPDTDASPAPDCPRHSA